jgi:hypothetical protein
MSIIKKYHDKKWTLQFLDALYNSIDSVCDPRVMIVRDMGIILGELYHYP